MTSESEFRDCLAGEQQVLAALSRQLQEEADRIAANCQVSDFFAFVDPGFLQLLQDFWDQHLRPCTLPLLQTLARLREKDRPSLDLQGDELLASYQSLLSARQDYDQGNHAAAREISRNLQALAASLRSLAAWLAPGPAAAPAAAPDLQTPVELAALAAALPSPASLAQGEELVRRLGQERCYRG